MYIKVWKKQKGNKINKETRNNKRCSIFITKICVKKSKSIINTSNEIIQLKFLNEK